MIFTWETNNGDKATIWQSGGYAPDGKTFMQEGWQGQVRLATLGLGVSCEWDIDGICTRSNGAIGAFPIFNLLRDIS